MAPEHVTVVACLTDADICLKHYVRLSQRRHVTLETMLLEVGLSGGNEGQFQLRANVYGSEDQILSWRRHTFESCDLWVLPI